jgi:hypothetical protein
VKIHTNLHTSEMPYQSVHYMCVKFGVKILRTFETFDWLKNLMFEFAEKCRGSKLGTKEVPLQISLKSE